jgi:hypothetical protein
MPEVAPIVVTAFYQNILGLDSASNFTDMPDGAAFDMLNVEGREEGLVASRDGTSKFLTTPLSASSLKIFDYTKNDGTQKIFSWAGTILSNITSGTPANFLTGLTNGLVPGVAQFNDRMVWGNGVDANKKTDGTNIWDLSVPAPTAYPSLATGVAGSITLTTGQKYHVVFMNSQTGERSNPFTPDNLGAAPNTGPITSKRVDVTRPSVPGGDPQVDQWEIYKTDDGGGTFKRHATAIPIATTTYNDNVTVPATSITLETDNDASVLTDILVEFRGSLFCVPIADPTKIKWSKIGNSSAWPLANEAPIGAKGDKNVGLFVHNKLLWIIQGFEVWVLPDHPSTGAIPFRVSDRGGWHKDAIAAIEDTLMVQARDGNFNQYQPTPFSFNEVRWQLRSFNLRGFLSTLNKAQLNITRAITWSGAGKNQLWFAIPFSGNVNNRICVFEHSLSKLNKRKESWWIWRFNFNVTCWANVKINGQDLILMGDDQGEVYKFPDIDGDGAQVNGTSSGSNTSTTLNDTSKTWTVNAFKNLMIRIIGGTGKDQEFRIVSNTSTQVTISGTWATIPDSTSQYTIGGYDKYYFSNWKNYGKEALRKRLRAVRIVGRQAGAYSIDVIVKRDFDASEGSALVLPFSLQGNHSLWGVMIWGVDPWGAATVTKGRLKFHGKFNSLQIGLRNRQAGQSFAVEGFSTFHQGLTYRTKQ